jgi:hypothetical protein
MGRSTERGSKTIATDSMRGRPRTETGRGGETMRNGYLKRYSKVVLEYEYRVKTATLGTLK